MMISRLTFIHHRHNLHNLLPPPPVSDAQIHVAEALGFAHEQLYI